MPLIKSISTPQIGINAYKVVSSKLENLWLQDTLIQSSSIALISWLHTMTIGHGNRSMHITDEDINSTKRIFIIRVFRSRVRSYALPPKGPYIFLVFVYIYAREAFSF